MQHIVVEELSEDNWTRYRDLRIAALENDGEAFGGNLESERLFSENQWREKARQYIGVAVLLDRKDIGIMTVENLNGDYGATCWVGSCWINPDFRRLGALRALFDYVDQNALARDWSVQGLGVWVDNNNAIKAYEKLGFVQMGDKQPSTRKPGMFYQRMIRKSPTS